MPCAGLPSSVRLCFGQPCSPFEAGALPVLRPARPRFRYGLTRAPHESPTSGGYRRIIRRRGRIRLTSCQSGNIKSVTNVPCLSVTYVRLHTLFDPATVKNWANSIAYISAKMRLREAAYSSSEMSDLRLSFSNCLSRCSMVCALLGGCERLFEGLPPFKSSRLGIAATA